MYYLVEYYLHIFLHILIFFLLSSLILISICLLYFNKDNYTNCTFGRIVAVPFLIISLCSLTILNIKIYSFYSLIFLLSYVLHFGQILVAAFSPDYKFGFDIFVQLNFDSFYKAQLFSLLFLILYIATGLLLYKENIRTEVGNLIEKNMITNITIISIIIFLPLQLYLWYKGIMIRVSGDYLDTLSNANNGYIELFAKFHIFGIAGLLILNKDKKMKSICILLVYCVFLVLSMLTGGRMYSISLMILIIGFYILLNNIKMNIKKIVVASISIIFIFNLLSSLSEIRNENVKNIDELISLVTTSDNSQINDFIAEMGATQFTMVLLKNQLNADLIDYSFGKSYIITFISVLPNINGSIKKIQDENNFVIKLNYRTLGGSAIAESFYNFGWLGSLVAIITAYMTIYIERKMKNALQGGKISKVFFYLIVMYALILWQRNTFLVFARYILYSYIFISICKKTRIFHFNLDKKGAEH